MDTASEQKRGDQSDRVCAAKTVAMWRFFGTVLFVIALVALGYYLFQAMSVTRYSTINVSGVGRASAAPDEASLVVGVQTESAESVAAAASENARILQRVLAAIGSSEKRKIESLGYETFPITQRNNNGNVTGTRFRVTNRAQVTLVGAQQVSQLAQVIDAATQAGASQVSSLTFTLQSETRERFVNEARTRAVQNAETKATQLARASGNTLGDVVRIEEPNSGVDGPGPQFALQRQVSLESSVETPVRLPEKIDVESQINVVYTLRQ